MDNKAGMVRFLLTVTCLLYPGGKEPNMVDGSCPMDLTEDQCDQLCLRLSYLGGVCKNEECVCFPNTQPIEIPKALSVLPSRQKDDVAADFQRFQKQLSSLLTESAAFNVTLKDLMKFLLHGFTRSMVIADKPNHNQENISDVTRHRQEPHPTEETILARGSKFHVEAHLEVISQKAPAKTVAETKHPSKIIYLESLREDETDTKPKKPRVHTTRQATDPGALPGVKKTNSSASTDPKSWYRVGRVYSRLPTWWIPTRDLETRRTQKDRSYTNRNIPTTTLQINTDATDGKKFQNVSAMVIITARDEMDKARTETNPYDNATAAEIEILASDVTKINNYSSEVAITVMGSFVDDENISAVVDDRNETEVNAPEVRTGAYRQEITDQGAGETPTTFLEMTTTVQASINTTHRPIEGQSRTINVSENAPGSNETISFPQRPIFNNKVFDIFRQPFPHNSHLSSYLASALTSNNDSPRSKKQAEVVDSDTEKQIKDDQVGEPEIVSFSQGNKNDAKPEMILNLDQQDFQQKTKPGEEAQELPELANRGLLI